jgi:hypothetical protein
MKIGLIDVDGYYNKRKKFQYPNLALMKVSAYYKKIKETVEVYNGFSHYDKVYMSKIFTFSEDYPFEVNSDGVLKGGTGYKLYDNLPEEIDRICPDYSLYDSKSAYGFLTRGCIRKCSWCVVPLKEGMIHAYADIDDFIADKNSAILMDNNVLAHEHGLSQIEKIISKKISIDFNQGLDARLIADNPEIAKLLSKVKWLTPLRMACDTQSQMDSVQKATELLRKYGTKPNNFFIYVLVKDIDDALKRVMFLKNLKLDPYAQPYRDFENNYVDPKLNQFKRWVNAKVYFKSFSWEEYKRTYKKQDNPEGIDFFL